MIDATAQWTAAGNTEAQSTQPSSQRVHRTYVHRTYEPARAALLWDGVAAAPSPRLSSLTLILNCSTRRRSCVDVSTNCCDALWVSVAPRVVLCAASATPVMLLVISPLPCAASFTLRDIW